MKAVVQRVLQASVTVDGQVVGSIRHGLLVLLCVEQGDTEREVDWMAGKLPGLRIFSDEEGKMNLSLMQIGGQLLLVSQFTLAGNVDKGFRPSFTQAARPEVAKPLLARLVMHLQAEGVVVEQGVFGADMQVALVNDGPVTLILERQAKA